MKLNKKQLLETIRDTIYEVLEEEIDRRLHKVKTNKARSLREGKIARIKALKAKAVRRAKIQKRKRELLESYSKLNAAEKKLATKSSSKRSRRRRSK